MLVQSSFSLTNSFPVGCCQRYCRVWHSSSLVLAFFSLAGFSSDRELDSYCPSSRRTVCIPELHLHLNEESHHVTRRQKNIITIRPLPHIFYRASFCELICRCCGFFFFFFLISYPSVLGKRKKTKKTTPRSGLNFYPFIFTGYVCEVGLSYGSLASTLRDLWAKLVSFYAVATAAETNSGGMVAGWTLHFKVLFSFWACSSAFLDIKNK